ncbi:hypothetical protein [Tenacibaculum mesophilum]|uniref:hypothetical protein n=1 Tax=Tenacibaculum mesophilum TaxID=104268 RepID=UPI00374921F9
MSIKLLFVSFLISTISFSQVSKSSGLYFAKEFSKDQALYKAKDYVMKHVIGIEEKLIKLVKRMKPFNLNARKNFNEKIKQELNNKFEYKRMNEDLKMKEKNFKIFIILNWNKNYEGKLVVEPTKV